MKVDPNQPRPTEYWAGIEWDALHEGKPPVVMNNVYNIPTDYHARMEQEAHYRREANKLKYGYHYNDFHDK